MAQKVTLKFVVDETTVSDVGTFFSTTKRPQETNDISLQSRAQGLSFDVKLSCFGQEFGSQCLSKDNSEKMETLKTNLLFSNPFTAENKEMIIVFVPKDPRSPRKQKSIVEAQK